MVSVGSSYFSGHDWNWGQTAKRGRRCFVLTARLCFYIFAFSSSLFPFLFPSDLYGSYNPQSFAWRLLSCQRLFVDAGGPQVILCVRLSTWVDIAFVQGQVQLWRRGSVAYIVISVGARQVGEGPMKSLSVPQLRCLLINSLEDYPRCVDKYVHQSCLRLLFPT